MRRFEIGSGEALVWVIVALAVCWWGSAPAFAQTYDISFDFTFYGRGGVIASGVIDFAGTSLYNANATSISGTVSGFRKASDNGTITKLLAPVSTTTDKIPFIVSGGAREAL